MAPAGFHNGPPSSRRIDRMPTLFKFLTVLAILAGIAYGGMFALVTLVEPKPGEMTVRIPVDKVNPPRE